MKVTFIITFCDLLVSLAFIGCKTQKGGSDSTTSSDTVTVCDRRKFKTDATGDSARFGFVNGAEDRSLGVTSMFVYHTEVFFLDDVYKNVKKVDLVSNEVSHSRPLTNSTQARFFNDISGDKDGLIITTSSNEVYCLNLFLEEIRNFKLPFSNSYIDTLTSDSIRFVSMRSDSIYTTTRAMGVISARPLINTEKLRWAMKFDLEKGIVRQKKVVFSRTSGADYLTVNNKTIRLCERFKYEDDAVNLDFDENVLVIFNNDSAAMKLFVYAISPNEKSPH